MSDRLSDAVDDIREECFRKHIREIMSTKPVKRSEKTRAIGEEMRKLISAYIDMPDQAVEAFAHLIEMMIEAKLDVTRDDM